MHASISTELRRRLDERIAAWRVGVTHVDETDSSVLAFGYRGRDAVVVKVVRNRVADGDEWNSGRILDAFGGNGVVRVYDYENGSLLLERLTPGTSLARIVLDGADDEATAALAGVIGPMAAAVPPVGVPTVEDWGRGFDRYLDGRDRQLPRELVVDARHVYLQLARSQSRPRLLHGDLHHYNVLLDANRGWLAIDPKGVIGEAEHEIGAALRNPSERPELFTEPSTIERRVAHFERVLKLDGSRMSAWAYAQAVLSVVWAIEDGAPFDTVMPQIHLAESLHQMLHGGGDT